MELQQWLVVSWIQFALQTLIILLFAQAVVRRLWQPVEKAWVIQLVLVAIAALPLLSAIPILPFRAVKLASLWMVEARTEFKTPSPKLSSPMDSKLQTQKNALEESSLSRSQASTFNNPTAASLEVAEQVQGPFASSDSLLQTSSRMQSTTEATNSEQEYWLLALLGLVLSHSLAAIYFLLQNRIGSPRLQQILAAAAPATPLVHERWTLITLGRGVNVRLLQSEHIDTPLTTGWRNPVLVLPFDLSVSTLSDLDACLVHEWSHIERSDAVVWYWMNLAQYVLWYQPIYWILRKELRLCQDFIADHKTVNSVTEPIAYTELLLRLARGKKSTLPEGASTMLGRSSQLSRRVKLLLGQQSAIHSRCRTSFTVGNLIGVVLLCVCTNSLRIQNVDAKEPITGASTQVAEANPVRSLAFTRTVAAKDSNSKTVYKEIVLEDGRFRSDLANADESNRRTSISDKMGESLLLSASRSRKVATKWALQIDTQQFAWLNFQKLRDGRKFANKELGTKELDGKQVSGFTMNCFDNTYSVWTEVATGELVQVEYDDPNEMHVTINQFQTGVAIDDGLFQCEIPNGYSRPANLGIVATLTGSFVSWLTSATDQPRDELGPAGMSLEWSRTSHARQIIGEKGGCRLWLSGFNQVSSIDSENRGLLKFKMDADAMGMADLDGDGTAELVIVQNQFIKDSRGFRTPKIERWKVSTFKVDGTPCWSYTSEALESAEWPITSAVALDLNGDGREEVILKGGSGTKAIDENGKPFRPPTKVKSIASASFGDLEGDGAAEFVGLTPNRNLQVSDLEGLHVREIAPSFRVSSVCIGRSRKTESSTKASIVSTGRFTDKPMRMRQSTFAVFDSEGAVKWKLDVEGHFSMRNVCECPSKPWMAIEGSRSVRVIDMDAGKEIASIGLPGYFRDLAWMTTTDGDALLVVSFADKIEAYRVKGDQ